MSARLDLDTPDGIRGCARWLIDDGVLPCRDGLRAIGEALLRYADMEQLVDDMTTAYAFALTFIPDDCYRDFVDGNKRLVDLLMARSGTTDAPHRGRLPDPRPGPVP